MHWRRIATLVPGRIGKQCRERWHNHLRPDINKCARWSREEDVAIHLGVKTLGHKWSAIVKSLPGRTDNQVKNRYNFLVNGARAHGATLVATVQYPDDPFLCELAQSNLATDAPARRPNLKRVAVPITNKISGRRNRGGKQRVWTHEEHARLAASVPKYSTKKAASDLAQRGPGACTVDWPKVAAVVGTRSASGCKEYWRARQSAPRCFRAPPPGTAEQLPEGDQGRGSSDEASVGAAEELDTFGSMDANELIAEYTEDPDLKFVAIETLDERAEVTSWTRSCAMVVGRRGDAGLNFRFPPLGQSLPRPPPVQVKVIEPSTETGRAWRWIQEKMRREGTRAPALPEKKARKRGEKTGRDFLAPGPGEAAPSPPHPPVEMTGFFQERKRRQEAEDLVKSVFA